MNYKLGVIGLTHGHVWGLLDQWAQETNVVLTAVADETPLLDRARDRFQTAYTDWRQLLAEQNPDIVLVTTDNRLGVKGDLGQVFHFKFRTGHAGPREIGCDPYFVGWLYDEQKNGGGAIADFGGYGAKMARFLMGMPEAVMAVRGNYTKDYPLCDDNGTLLLRYPNGAAVLEGTWSQIGSDGAGNPMLYGTEGTATLMDGRIRVHRRGQEVQMLEPVPLAEGERNAPDYFLTCLREERAMEGMVSPVIGRDAQAILAAALESCATGQAVKPKS
ncbi:MAG: Gfo/Idh/MocA family oxidoreductase [Fimbriimonadia bacterium]|nr:Gfo/Idh/MocA family oxidoreductase [Fimbriimonadia bacterium]